MSGKRPSLLPEPTLTGPKTVRAGGASYGVPQSAGVVVAAGGHLANVLYRARLHLFGARGEIEIPQAVRHALAARYFGGRA